MSITSRMNYFTGFFTTARDWNEGQDYHLQKRKLHNRSLHSPGIIQGEYDNFGIVADGSLTVTVQAGAALDGMGNEIIQIDPVPLTLDPERFESFDTLYLRVSYREQPDNYVDNVETPQYSGHTRITERPRIEWSAERPDNHSYIELARVQCDEEVLFLSNPVDPLNPGMHEIDCRNVLYAGSLGLMPERLTFELRERIMNLMNRIRTDFAALESQFPVPSSADVRHGAMTVGMLACTDGISRPSIPGLMSTLGAVELDVAQEIADRYLPVCQLVEYEEYQQAVTNLLQGIRDGLGAEDLLNLEDDVGVAARNLGDAIVLLPVADAGPDFTVPTEGDEGAVSINAGNSMAFGGREIVRYHWRFPDLYTQPVADSGLDHTVFAAGEEETVTLDASGSQAYGGKGIVRYLWSIRNDE